MPKLTKRLVEAVEPEGKDVILRDSEIKGFLCKITPKGKRIYLLYYRTKAGRERKPVIGEHDILSCEEARVIAQEWRAEVARGGDPSADKHYVKSAPTVWVLSERYMEERKEHLKPRSYDEIERIWKKYINPEIGHLKLPAVSTQDIVKLHRAHAHHPYMANRILETLRSAFGHAIRAKIIRGENPTLHIAKYKEHKRERFLSTEEVLRLSGVLHSDEVTATEMPSVLQAIKLLLFTGCRLNEILTLQWPYVDFEHQCLRLPDSKTGAKTVYLCPPAREILSAIKREQDEVRKAKNSAKESDQEEMEEEKNDYVIVGRHHGHLINLQKPWRRIRKKAGLDDLRLHDLRHSFASVGTASGLSLPIIGALLGHKHAATTQRYAHLLGDPLKEAAGIIGKRIATSFTPRSEVIEEDNVVVLREKAK